MNAPHTLRIKVPSKSFWREALKAAVGAIGWVLWAAGIVFAAWITQVWLIIAHYDAQMAGLDSDTTNVVELMKYGFAVIPLHLQIIGPAIAAALTTFSALWNIWVRTW